EPTGVPSGNEIIFKINQASNGDRRVSRRSLACLRLIKFQSPFGDKNPNQRKSMWRYIVRRLLQTIPVALGATQLIYALLFFQQGAPFMPYFAENPVP